MKKIVFINLQDNDFMIKTFEQNVFKRGTATKHRFYLDYLLSDPDIEVMNYIAVNKKHKGIIKWLIYHFKKFENYYCLNKAGIRHKVKIIDDFENLTKNDYIVYYLHFPSSFDFGQNCSANKSVCLSHLYGLKEEAELIKRVNPTVLWGDGKYNSYSELYRKNFAWFKGLYIESKFVPEARFINNVKFEERKNKAFATGTVTNCDAKEFIENYGSDCYQPLREQILVNSENLKDILESKISHREEIKLKKPKNDSLFETVYCFWFNETHTGKQKQYYSFNMASKFNEHKICVVPEDINGIPGVGFVEGMACGCAYLGYDKIDYSSYGMKAGENYITYDGTIDGLRATLNYYFSNEDELSRIANNGYKLVKETLIKDIVAKELFEKMFAYGGAE